MQAVGCGLLTAALPRYQSADSQYGETCSPERIAMAPNEWMMSPSICFFPCPPHKTAWRTYQKPLFCLCLISALWCWLWTQDFCGRQHWWKATQKVRTPVIFSVFIISWLHGDLKYIAVYFTKWILFCLSRFCSHLCNYPHAWLVLHCRLQTPFCTYQNGLQTPEDEKLYSLQRLVSPNLLTKMVSRLPEKHTRTLYRN